MWSYPSPTRDGTLTRAASLSSAATTISVSRCCQRLPPDRKGRRGTQARRVRKAIPERRDHKGSKALRATRGHKDRKARKARQGLKALLDRAESTEPRVRLDPKVQ